jgi:hypothetical protein
LALVCAAAVSASAATVTNLGNTITVTTMSDLASAGTVTKDQSTPPQSGTMRAGWYIVHYEVPAAGITGAVDIATADIPKGTILLEDAVIEVQTAILPAAGTASLAVGGVTLLADGNSLESAAVVSGTAANLPDITDADDKLAITVSGTTATQGVFTVYLPVVAGNAQ